MMDRNLFEDRLSALFHGGELLHRELRLTPVEYNYLVDTYPAAVLTPMEDGWYELSWKEAR